MKNKPLDIADFLRLVIEALNAAGVEYLIGGAIAESAWGEPRATQDLDLVVKIPIKPINKLSKELKKRDMLIPAEINLDTILEERADIAINAIHTHSSFKAELYPVRMGMSFAKAHFNDGKGWIMVLPSGRYISIHQRISFCTSSWTLGSVSNPNIPEISQPFSNLRKMNLIWTISSAGQLA